MSSVLSHIVLKHLSTEHMQHEDMATESLAFILQDKKSHARSGLMKFLRKIAPSLPSLLFRTQQSKDSTRPDMAGFDGSVTRAFIENKFWAGLTSEQPVGYLKRLAQNTQPSVLLFVVPEERQEWVWRDLLRKIKNTPFCARTRGRSAGVVRSVVTKAGPILALTSWATLLEAIGSELTDEPQAKNDLLQLRSLCDAVDSKAFVPISAAEVTNQRTPAFLLQVSNVAKKALELAEEEGFVENARNLQEWDFVGKYMAFPKGGGAGGRFGIDLTLWKDCGSTPLWLEFWPRWGRAAEVRPVLEPWIDRKGIVAKWWEEEGTFVVGIQVATGEEEASVIASVVNQLREISKVLSKLKRKRK